jgi:uncharacterized protein (TIRG00374 family)
LNNGHFSDKKLWIGIGISLLLLYLLFRKIDTGLLLASLTRINCLYLIPAAACTMAGYYLRALRWKYLLSPIKDTSMGNLFSSTIIGYMANNLLPARIGELIRAYVLGNKEGIDKSSVLATLVLDRLLDGLSVIALLGVTLVMLELPSGMEGPQKWLEYGGTVTVVFYLVIIIALAALKLWSAPAIALLQRVLKPFPERVGQKGIALADSFLTGIRFPAQWSKNLGLILSSALIWALAVWTVDLILSAFGIVLPLTASLFILVLIVFAIMVPSSPGYVGTYHAACMYALMAFSLPKEQALSIALIIHGMNFFPVTLLGLWYVAKDRINWRGVQAGKAPGEGVVE